jgi:phosphatidylethanolamine/phosphatidyl-N-methylethanolamine N-methyltransferase
MATTASTQPHESALYYEFSHFYDAVFGRVFYPRIAKVIRSLSIERGARVLEIGVGTGLSLGAYPSHCQVTGIDLAPDMLERAQERIDRNGWTHVTLEQGDALALRFPDDTFDYVMAFHVASVVPDAGRLMAEAQRVCRPGGMIAVINHFRSTNRALARLQRTIDPVTRRLGWTPSLRLPDILDRRALHVERQWKTSAHSLFTIVVARNAKAIPAAATGASARA